MVEVLGLEISQTVLYVLIGFVGLIIMGIVLGYDNLRNKKRISNIEQGIMNVEGM